MCPPCSFSQALASRRKGAIALANALSGGEVTDVPCAVVPLYYTDASADAVRTALVNARIDGVIVQASASSDATADHAWTRAKLAETLQQVESASESEHAPVVLPRPEVLERMTQARQYGRFSADFMDWLGYGTQIQVLVVGGTPLLLEIGHGSTYALEEAARTHWVVAESSVGVDEINALFDATADSPAAGAALMRELGGDFQAASLWLWVATFYVDTNGEFEVRASDGSCCELTSHALAEHAETAQLFARAAIEAVTAVCAVPEPTEQQPAPSTADERLAASSINQALSFVTCAQQANEGDESGAMGDSGVPPAPTVSHRVTCTLTLSEMELGHFDTIMRQEFSESLAETLEIDIDQIDLGAARAGSVVVDALITVDDGEAATRLVSKLEDPTAVLANPKFGTCAASNVYHESPAAENADLLQTIFMFIDCSLQPLPPAPADFDAEDLALDPDEEAKEDFLAEPSELDASAAAASPPPEDSPVEDGSLQSTRAIMALAAVREKERRLEEKAKRRADREARREAEAERKRRVAQERAEQASIRREQKRVAIVKALKDLLKEGVPLLKYSKRGKATVRLFFTVASPREVDSLTWREPVTEKDKKACAIGSKSRRSFRYSFTSREKLPFDRLRAIRAGSAPNSDDPERSQWFKCVCAEDRFQPLCFALVFERRRVELMARTAAQATLFMRGLPLLLGKPELDPLLQPDRAESAGI